MPINMPQPVWSVVIGQPTEAYWGQNVAERVVQMFANATSRSTLWTAPIPAGAISVLTNTTPPTTHQFYGSAWHQIGPAILASPSGIPAQTGAQVIGGQLTVLGRLINAGSPNADDDVVNRGWVNTQLGGRVAVTGDTIMPGPLLLRNAQGDPASPTGPSAAINLSYANDTYVNVDGDTMTGALTMHAQLTFTGNVDTDGRINMNNHKLFGLRDPENVGEAVPKGWADANYLQKPSDTVGTANDTGFLTYGNQPSSGKGCRLNENGQMNGSVNDAGVPNMILRRGPAADAVDQVYLSFRRPISPDTIIGSITIDTGQDNVAYHGRVVAQSDYRLKEEIGPVADASGKVIELASHVYHGRWLATGIEGDFINAHDVAPVAPYAVRGDKDGEQMQGVTFPELVPLLIRALGEALDRIDALEARAA